MKVHEYLQSLDQMARISRVELGSRLDEILDIVITDNVGYVITDEGKNDLVLCPARWFECAYDTDFCCFVNSALRYAIGRHTYMPPTVMGFVRKNIDVLEKRTISVMIDDIEREAEDETLDKRDDWLMLRDDLKAHYDARLKKGAGRKEKENE